MLRRSLVAVSLATALLALSGCMSCDEPMFPRLRSLLPGGNGPCCPPAVAYDLEGPILEPSPVVGAPPVIGNGVPAVVNGVPADGSVPQPRIVPQPLTQPEAQPVPYNPTKKTK